MSLKIATGEFVGVLGPNGAGKTTLMRAVLGLVPASRGTIRVLGRPAARGNPAIGYMPQVRSSGSLRLSGWDFVAAVVDGHRLGCRSRARRRALRRSTGPSIWSERANSRNALWPRHRAASGSGCLLAQALIGRPQIAAPGRTPDQPRSAVISARSVRLTKALQTELRHTVLFSAHELNPLLGALDRVLYLGQDRRHWARSTK